MTGLMIPAFNHSMAKQQFMVVFLTTVSGIYQRLCPLRTRYTNAINTGMCVITSNEVDRTSYYIILSMYWYIAHREL